MKTHPPATRRPLARRRHLRRVVLCLALGPALTACDPADSLTDEPELDAAADADVDAPQGVELSYAEYLLTYAWGEAEPLEGGGWTTVNDLGYRVEVELGYLVSYSASLSPCTPAGTADTSSSTTASLGERLLGRLMLPGTAFAGHASAADPSQIEAPTLEDLALPTDRSFGATEFEPADYCWVHYLAAQADEDTPSLPADAEMEGATLYLEGQVWIDDAHAEPFTLRATTASGVLVDLRQAPSDDPSAAGEAATLTVVRDLAHAFDGFDFATDDPAELDRLVLRHLVQEATVELQRAPAPTP